MASLLNTPGTARVVAAAAAGAVATATATTPLHPLPLFPLQVYGMGCYDGGGIDVGLDIPAVAPGFRPIGLGMGDTSMPHAVGGESASSRCGSRSKSPNMHLPSNAEEPLQLSRTLAGYKVPLPGMVSGVNVYGVVGVKGGTYTKGDEREENQKEAGLVTREGKDNDNGMGLEDIKKMEERVGEGVSERFRRPAFGLGLGFLRGRSAKVEEKEERRKESEQESVSGGPMLYSFPSSLLAPRATTPTICHITKPRTP